MAIPYARRIVQRNNRFRSRTENDPLNHFSSSAEKYCTHKPVYAPMLHPLVRKVRVTEYVKGIDMPADIRSAFITANLYNARPSIKKRSLRELKEYGSSNKVPKKFKTAVDALENGQRFCYDTRAFTTGSAIATLILVSFLCTAAGSVAYHFATEPPEPYYCGSVIDSGIDQKDIDNPHDDIWMAKIEPRSSAMNHVETDKDPFYIEVPIKHANLTALEEKVAGSESDIIKFRITETAGQKSDFNKYLANDVQVIDAAEESEIFSQWEKRNTDEITRGFTNFGLALLGVFGIEGAIFGIYKGGQKARDGLESLAEMDDPARRVARTNNINKLIRTAQYYIYDNLIEDDNYAFDALDKAVGLFRRYKDLERIVNVAADGARQLDYDTALNRANTCIERCIKKVSRKGQFYNTLLNLNLENMNSDKVSEILENIIQSYDGRVERVIEDPYLYDTIRENTTDAVVSAEEYAKKGRFIEAWRDINRAELFISTLCKDSYPNTDAMELHNDLRKLFKTKIAGKLRDTEYLRMALKTDIGKEAAEISLTLKKKGFLPDFINIEQVNIDQGTHIGSQSISIVDSVVHRSKVGSLR